MIEKKFLEKCSIASDISEHLPTLLRYGKECKHITEMGTRDVVSTWAWLMAKPEKLVCYDIVRSPNIDEAIEASEGVLGFIEADVLKVEIEPTDLLFIDTLHTYSQLKQELALHAKNIKKYIIFHDIVTYGHTPEPSHFKTHAGIVSQHPRVLKNYVANDKGIMPAIEEFLRDNPQWKEKERFNNNNGLLVIERNG